MTKKYIQYEEYLKNKKRVDGMVYNGWEMIHEKSVMKIALGLILIMVGIVTLPIPTGSIPMIIVGFSLLSSGGIDILALKNSLYWKVKTRLEMRKNKC